MLANSYLIVGPTEPTDISGALITQRQTIPLAWAFASASPSSRLISANGHHYFETRIDDALKLLDRALAAWNYNSYFRDTLAPVLVFRKWLANFPGDNNLYLNITELVKRSVTAERDLEELRSLREKVARALEEIEKKDFTLFLRELRRLAFPFVTVPITGDRERDVQILTYELRDTTSVEAEMALQMIGVDRDKSLLNQAIASIKLRRGQSEERPSSFTELDVDDPADHVTLFTKDLDSARRLFVDRIGFSVIEESDDRVIIEANGSEFRISRVRSS